MHMREDVSGWRSPGFGGALPLAAKSHTGALTGQRAVFPPAIQRLSHHRPALQAFLSSHVASECKQASVQMNNGWLS